MPRATGSAADRCPRPGESPPVVNVEALNVRGEGVAGELRIPRSLPGEIVTGRVENGRIDAPRIVTPSPDRVAPPCPHFRRCGACSLQHARDGFVAVWKAQVVRDALARVGIGAEIARVETSPAGTRRRAALAGRKTKKGAQVGFHVARGAEIVAIPSCRVLRADILAALPTLEALTRVAAPRGAEIGLHVTATETGLDLAVTGAKPWDRATMEAVAPLAPAFARATWNGEPALQQMAPVVAFGPARVTPPPAAFLQATAEGEAALVASTARTLTDASRVIDLFSGCGTFTFPAARSAAVHAVEGDGAALGALAQAARHATGLRPITTERRNLARAPVTTKELGAYDVAILDPPRAGAAAQVDELARADLRAIAAISCKPATFARDAATLVAAGWRMGPVTVVDQFRWSAHIELAATFTRA
jgi:23S rRNA (uracil1939-C5)-methyltransferase